MNSQTVLLYWWTPLRPLRVLAGTLLSEWRTWARLAQTGVIRPSNFGDEFSRTAVFELTGARARWAPPRQAELACVGSIIDTLIAAGSRATILGAGVRGDLSEDEYRRSALRFVGVRGQLSAASLGPRAQGAFLGDPGLLASTVYPRADRRGGVVVLPHFSEFGRPRSRDSITDASRRGWRIVTPHENPREVAAKIASADFVLTSSLHGLVFADSFGVPAQLVKFGSGNSERSLKYHDYMTALDAEVDVSTMFAPWLTLTENLSDFQLQAADRRDRIRNAVDECTAQMFRAARAI